MPSHRRDFAQRRRAASRSVTSEPGTSNDPPLRAFRRRRLRPARHLRFLALPHTASMAIVPELRKAGVRVIDLSADYRLADPRSMRTGTATHTPMPKGLAEAVYGLPELFREQIPPAGLIANPGCYTSASILRLRRSIAEDRIERTGIIIDAKSGVSGAGRSPKLTTHFPECNESLSAYSVGRHRQRRRSTRS